MMALVYHILLVAATSITVVQGAQCDASESCSQMGSASYLYKDKCYVINRDIRLGSWQEDSSKCSDMGSDFSMKYGRAAVFLDSNMYVDIMNNLQKQITLDRGIWIGAQSTNTGDSLSDYCWMTADGQAGSQVSANAATINHYQGTPSDKSPFCLSTNLAQPLSFYGRPCVTSGADDDLYMVCEFGCDKPLPAICPDGGSGEKSCKTKGVCPFDPKALTTVATTIKQISSTKSASNQTKGTTTQPQCNVKSSCGQDLLNTTYRFNNACYALVNVTDSSWNETNSICGNKGKTFVPAIPFGRVAAFVSDNEFWHVLWTLSNHTNATGKVYLGAQAKTGGRNLSDYCWMTDQTNPGSQVTNRSYGVSVSPSGSTGPYCLATHIGDGTLSGYYGSPCDQQNTVSILTAAPAGVGPPITLAVSVSLSANLQPNGTQSTSSTTRATPQIPEDTFVLCELDCAMPEPATCPGNTGTSCGADSGVCWIEPPPPTTVTETSTTPASKPSDPITTPGLVTQASATLSPTSVPAEFSTQPPPTTLTPQLLSTASANAPSSITINTVQSSTDLVSKLDMTVVSTAITSSSLQTATDPNTLPLSTAASPSSPFTSPGTSTGPESSAPTGLTTATSIISDSPSTFASFALSEETSATATNSIIASSKLTSNIETFSTPTAAVYNTLSTTAEAVFTPSETASNTASSTASATLYSTISTAEIVSTSSATASISPSQSADTTTKTMETASTPTRKTIENSSPLPSTITSALSSEVSSFSETVPLKSTQETGSSGSSSSLQMPTATTEQPVTTVTNVPSISSRSAFSTVEVVTIQTTELPQGSTSNQESSLPSTVQVTLATSASPSATSDSVTSSSTSSSNFETSSPSSSTLQSSVATEPSTAPSTTLKISITPKEVITTLTQSTVITTLPQSTSQKLTLVTNTATLPPLSTFVETTFTAPTSQTRKTINPPTSKSTAATLPVTSESVTASTAVVTLTNEQATSQGPTSDLTTQFKKTTDTTVSKLSLATTSEKTTDNVQSLETSAIVSTLESTNSQVVSTKQIKFFETSLPPLAPKLTTTIVKDTSISTIELATSTSDNILPEQTKMSTTRLIASESKTTLTSQPEVTSEAKHLLTADTGITAVTDKPNTELTLIVLTTVHEQPTTIATQKQSNQTRKIIENSSPLPSTMTNTFSGGVSSFSETLPKTTSKNTYLFSEITPDAGTSSSTSFVSIAASTTQIPSLTEQRTTATLLQDTNTEPETSHNSDTNKITTHQEAKTTLFDLTTTLAPKLLTSSAYTQESTKLNPPAVTSETTLDNGGNGNIYKTIVSSNTEAHTQQMTPDFEETSELVRATSTLDGNSFHKTSETTVNQATTTNSIKNDNINVQSTAIEATTLNEVNDIVKRTKKSTIITTISSDQQLSSTTEIQDEIDGQVNKTKKPIVGTTTLVEMQTTQEVGEIIKKTKQPLIPTTTQGQEEVGEIIKKTKQPLIPTTVADMQLETTNVQDEINGVVNKTRKPKPLPTTTILDLDLQTTEIQDEIESVVNKTKKPLVTTTATDLLLETISEVEDQVGGIVNKTKKPSVTATISDPQVPTTLAEIQDEIGGIVNKTKKPFVTITAPDLQLQTKFVDELGGVVQKTKKPTIANKVGTEQIQTTAHLEDEINGNNKKTKFPAIAATTMASLEKNQTDDMDQDSKTKRPITPLEKDQTDDIDQDSKTKRPMSTSSINADKTDNMLTTKKLITDETQATPEVLNTTVDEAGNNVQHGRSKSALPTLQTTNQDSETSQRFIQSTITVVTEPETQQARSTTIAISTLSPWDTSPFAVSTIQNPLTPEMPKSTTLKLQQLTVNTMFTTIGFVRLTTKSMKHDAPVSPVFGATTPPDPCLVYEWGPYSSCGMTCGSSVKMRQRQLSAFDNSSVGCLGEVADCGLPECTPMSVIEQTITNLFMDIGCIWIMVGLASSILGFVIFRSRYYLQIIHVNEDVSLFFAHLLVLLFSMRNDSKWSQQVCKIAAIGLQYFFGVTYTFQALEAFHIFTVLTNVVMGNDVIIGIKTAMAIGWGLPAIITGATGGVLYNSLMSRFSCWVNLDDNNIFLANVIPTMVIGWSTIILLEATGHWNEFSKSDTIHSCMLARGGLGCVFGCQFASWIMAITATFYQHISFFTIVFGFNTALGVFIFIYHLFANQKARLAARNLYRRMRGQS